MSEDIPGFREAANEAFDFQAKTGLDDTGTLRLILIALHDTKIAAHDAEVTEALRGEVARGNETVETLQHIVASKIENERALITRAEVAEAEVARLTRQIDATVGVVERDNRWRDEMKARAEAAEAKIAVALADIEVLDEAERTSEDWVNPDMRRASLRSRALDKLTAALTSDVANVPAAPEGER